MDSLTSLMKQPESIINVQFLDNNLLNWLSALTILVLTFWLVSLIKRQIVQRFGLLAEQSETQWDDLAINLVKQTRTWFVFSIALFIASLSLTVSDFYREMFRNIVTITLLIQGGMWVAAVISARLEQYRQKQLKINPASVTTLNAVGFISTLLLWTVILLLALDNLGVDITALIAGLGVGGIAVALAVQNILGDLFASLSIILDKPFTVGDFLIINEHLGSVEYVGLKTTRLRSLSGEQLVFSNSDLLNSRIRNFGRMYERRVVFSISVTYQTPRDKLKLVPEILREAIESQEQTRFDRSHFKEFGAFALNFETVYYVLLPDYNTYMDIQQAINLTIHEHFEQHGIEFAYPTQTLILETANQSITVPSTR